MRFSAIAAGLFAAVAIATPIVKREDDCDDGAPCMTQADAETVAANFRSLIVDFSAADAKKFLTANYHDYSSSVNTLIDSGCTTPLPLDAVTFASRAAFITGQGSQPAIPWQTLNVWHTCDTVIARWRSAQAPEEITGIVVMETAYVDGEYKIETVYSEFNSGAWLVDIGVWTPSCPAS